jgi:Recombination endonuclease VII
MGEVMMDKGCTKCGEILPLDRFNKNKSAKDGLQYWCKACTKASMVEWKGKQPPKPPRPKTSKNQRDYNLKHKFGLTMAEYNQMVADQGGRCAACGAVPETTFHVDHDHRCCPGSKTCGKCVRSLLCHPCNVTLGFMRDDSDRLRALADYLDRSNTNT